MLRTFFELEYDYNGNVVDKKRYFEGKKIMSASDEILSMMGKYPVIKLSLKSAKQPNFREAALKTNDALKFGVVTGCLRISKESIFTGLV